MVSMLGSSPDRVKPKTIKLVYVVSLIKEKEQRLVGWESG
jgi:hypothetical protein